MLERGSGYLLQTVSAAGLLSCAGDAPYTATKHAALGFAEWLSMTYGNLGIKVSALCPMGVRHQHADARRRRTANPSALAVAASAPILEPEQVAGPVVNGLDDERFLILPHPEVAEFARRKVDDRDRWLGGLRRLVATVHES